jgi:RNA polymerase sigma factor (sigma-70 family)
VTTRDTRGGMSSPPLTPSEGIGGEAMAEFDFAGCYHTEMPVLVAYVMSLGATEQEAMDAAQSAFLDAYKVWSTIDSPRAWLRTVAMRAYLKSRVPETLTDAWPVLESTGDRLPAASVEFTEQERAVVAALQGLPIKQRQAMAWHFDGFSPTEIAERLNTDPAAVRQNLRKARRNLKKLLGITGRQPR